MIKEVKFKKANILTTNFRGDKEQETVYVGYTNVTKEVKGFLGNIVEKACSQVCVISEKNYESDPKMFKKLFAKGVEVTFNKEGFLNYEKLYVKFTNGKKIELIGAEFVSSIGISSSDFFN